MLDVIDAGGERSLEDRYDTRLHFRRRQACIAPDDADDRNVDAREDINRCAEQNDRADQKQHQREYDERIRACERQFYYPHTEPLRIAEPQVSRGCSPGSADWSCPFLATITLACATAAPMPRELAQAGC